MNNFHRNIHIPFGISAYDYQTRPGLNNTIDFTRIEPVFFEWLNDYGITCCPIRSRYFLSNPYDQYTIHADSIQNTSENTKINLIFDSYNTIMKWYELKPRYNRLPEKLFVHNGIRIYRDNHCEEVFSTPVNENCIIDGSKIHTLINGDNQGKKRKCFSFTLRSLRTNKLLSFEESIGLLGI